VAGVVVVVVAGMVVVVVAGVVVVVVGVVTLNDAAAPFHRYSVPHPVENTPTFTE
jgi:hypothetical protein